MQAGRRRPRAGDPCPETAHRGRYARGRRPSFVDIEGSAVVQNEPNVVVAAESVVPGEPIADHRGLVIHPAKNAADDLLIAGEHPLRVFNTFRSAGGTRSEQ